MERSVRWAARCRERLDCCASARRPEVTVTNPGQAQFGIVQGGVFQDLRDESADATVAIGFEGYAIGGLSVGEPIDVMYDSRPATARRLPAAQPRYLMGAGTPEDLVECVARGIDMFDCVHADAQRPQRPALHQPGAPQHQERALRRGRRPARSGVRLLHLPARIRAPISGTCTWPAR